MKRLRFLVIMAAGAAVMLLGLARSAYGQQAGTTATAAIDEGMKDDLALWLTFDERHQTPPHFLDASGRNNHAVSVRYEDTYRTKADMRITTDGGGKQGEGVICKTYEWLTVPGSGLNLTEWVTVECWVKPSVDMGHREHGWIGIVSKGISGACDVYGLRFKGHTGSLQFVIRDQGKPYVAEAKRKWKANTWYHLKGRYDGQTLRLYENDVLLDETPHRGRIDTTTLPLLIGAGWGWNYGFSGILDSVRIWGVVGEGAADADGRAPRDGRIRLYPHEFERSVTIQHPAFPDALFKHVVPELVGNDQGTLYNHYDWSPVTWKGPDTQGVIGYRGENERVVFSVTMTPYADSIEARHSVTNKTTTTWQHVYTLPCLSTAMTPPFQDFGMERAVIPIAGKGLLAPRDVFGKGGVRGLCRMVEPSFGRHAQIDSLAGLGGIITPLKAEYPYVGIASRDGKWIVGMATEKAGFLLNYGVNSCIHASPYFGQVNPGETKSVLSRIYFLKGNADTLSERYRRDFLDGERKATAP